MNTSSYSPSSFVRVSIALCTFNGKSFLDEQLESIFRQNYPLYELVIVDDHSTDQTYELLQRWKERYPDLIKLYRNEKNIGYDRNFEKALSYCSGDWIAISDQDDVWMEDKISALAELLRQPDVVLAHGASVTLKNGKLHYYSGQLNRYRLFEGNDSRKLFLCNQLSGHNMMFKRSLLAKALPLPEEMHYDWWIALQATTMGKIKAVNRYLVHHRKHGENAFFSKKRKKNVLTFTNRLLLFKQINGYSAESQKFLNDFILKVRATKHSSYLRFNWELFKFFWVHGKVFFGHKKRIFPAFTYFTNAIHLSK